MALGGFAGAFITATTGLSLSSKKLVLNRHVLVNPNEESDTSYQYYEDKEERVKDDSYPQINVHSYGPERDLRDPSPTVSVPYRIIRKNDSNSINNETVGDNYTDFDIEENNYAKQESIYEELESDTQYEDNDLINRNEKDIGNNHDEWGEDRGENW